MFPFFAMSLFICFPLPHVWVPAIPIADKNLPLRGPGDCRWNDMVNHAVLLAVGIHVCSPGSPRDFKKNHFRRNFGLRRLSALNIVSHSFW